MRYVSATLFFAAMMPSLAFSQDAEPSISPSVFQVVSGGYWEAGARRGSYRAVVELIGIEHVSCRLWVEWLTDAQPSQPRDVAARVLVEEISDGLWSCHIAPQQQPFVDGDLIVAATQTYTLEDRTFEVTVSGPGEYSVEEQ